MRNVANLDEHGKISDRKKLGDTKDAQGVTEEDELSDSDSDERTGVFDFQMEEDRERFIKVFKKAHMEIASQMSRSASDFRRDRGAGVNFDGEQQVSEGRKREYDPALEEKVANEDHSTGMGILEEPAPQETVNEIVTQMQQLLKASDRPAREIWLDALLTVLEESGALHKLQSFFMPKPMIHPKKLSDWAAYYKKKEKMERRLNRFFNLIIQEAELRQYQYLKEMAVAKERVLKQQSLVLNDYLVSLDSEIAQVRTEIKSLEKRNSSIQTTVSPLL